MKVLLGTLLGLSVLLLAAPDAAAHGGSFAHTNGGVPPGLREQGDSPPPPVAGCNYCAKPDCPNCSARDLVAGTRLAFVRQNLYVRGSVGDVLRVDVEVRFKAKQDVRMIEAYAPVGIAPVFAVTAASIKHGGRTLRAVSARASEANRRYLAARRRAKDPLLLTPRAPGVYDLRAFPVVPKRLTTVRITGYTLAERTPKRIRLYRTGARYMAIVPNRLDDHPTKAAFVDRSFGRALHFMTREQARKRYGATAVWAARAVRCVPDLERTVSSAKPRTWVALPRR